MLALVEIDAVARIAVVVAAAAAETHSSMYVVVVYAVVEVVAVAFAPEVLKKLPTNL